MQDKTKRVAKNSVILSLRMLITMAISLYASRLILDVLGVEDFGIYNIVGGVVVMLAFMNNVMAISVSRFLGLAIGEDDKDKLVRIFMASTNLHITLAIIIVIFAEIFGAWYIPNYLNVPPSRYHAAYCVFHLSVVATSLNVMRVPLIASVTINEDMNVFAIFSFTESILKLIIIYMLCWNAIDKLIMYGLLMLCVTVIVTSLYIIYCKKTYFWCKCGVCRDKLIYREIIRFAGFNTFGNMIGLIVDNGQNILLNLFFGPAINAARGIAFQVNNALKGFVGNIFAAVNPQIFKSYGENNLDYVKKLLYNSTRLSFSLMLLFCLPIILNAEYILGIWLKQVPAYSKNFVILILLNSIVYANTQPLLISIHATGKIGKLHLYTGLINSMNLILSYILLNNGYPPEAVFLVQIGVSIGMIVTILYIMSQTLCIGIVEYTKNIYYKELVILLLVLPIPLYLSYLIEQNFLRLVVITFSVVVCVLISTFYVGLEKIYRDKIVNRLLNSYGT